MGKGHPVKGNNRKGQFRALYAKGVLHSSGKGKGRRTSYNKGASGSVIGGKTAHLQGGGSKGGKVDHSATRATRVAAGKAQAMKHPLVKAYAEGPHGLAGLKVNQKAMAHAAVTRRAEQAAKKTAVAKAHENYTKSLIRANRSLLDDKAQRAKKRAYDTLISTISGGSKSRQGSHRAEIDSALRRAKFAASKAR